MEVGRRDLSDPLVTHSSAFSVELNSGAVVLGEETYFAVRTNWDADPADTPTSDFLLFTIGTPYLELLMAGGGRMMRGIGG